jgi:type III secretion protein U
MAEKTEPASQKKLKDSRKKGQVAKSQDFPAAITFVVAVSVTVAMSSKLYDQFGQFMITMLKAGPRLKPGTSLQGIINHALQMILDLSLPILFLTLLAGVVTTFLLVGPVFSTEVLKMQLKRLNPVENLKQKFKIKTWVELLKQLLKVGVAFYLMYGVIHDSIGLLVSTCMLPVMAQAWVVKELLMKVIIRVTIFFLGIATFDLVFQRRQFAKEMKMEKFEVKQEYKDTEGDPEIKWKRKQIAREIAYDEGPRAVRRARAVVTNPTHMALALAYDPVTDPAPMLLAKTIGPAAQEMVRLAGRYNVPVIENVPLAHLLFYKGQAGQYIPAESFELVAQLFMTLQQIEEQRRLEASIGAF